MNTIRAARLCEIAVKKSNNFGKLFGKFTKRKIIDVDIATNFRKYGSKWHRYLNDFSNHFFKCKFKFEYVVSFPLLPFRAIIILFLTQPLEFILCMINYCNLHYDTAHLKLDFDFDWKFWLKLTKHWYLASDNSFFFSCNFA